MILLARILKFLFRFPFFEKRYFGIYQRVIRPWGWFKKTMVTIPYDKTLQIQLHLRDWIQQQIYFFNYYDERGIRCIKKELKKEREKFTKKVIVRIFGAGPLHLQIYHLCTLNTYRYFQTHIPIFT